LRFAGAMVVAVALAVGAMGWVAWAAAGAQPEPPAKQPPVEPWERGANKMNAVGPRADRGERLWAELLLDDPDASRAVLDLAAAPKEAIALFAKKLEPLKADKADVKKWIADLGSEKQEVWEAAVAKLGHFDPRLAMDPQEAFAEATTPAAKQRLVAILLAPHDLERLNSAGLQLSEVTSQSARGSRTFWLNAFDGGRRIGATQTYPLAHRVSDVRRPTWTRDVRAVVILERTGTAEAQAVLKRVAEGHPDALVTQTAKSALARLTAPAP
jgi:hypothetical protein